MNFKNILSTNSVASSVSRSYDLGDITKLQNEIELLRQNVSALKLLLESRETAIGLLARGKKNLYIDLTKVQRIKNKIEQQLLHERKMNSIHKECLLDAKKHILNDSEKSDASYGVVSYNQLPLFLINREKKLISSIQFKEDRFMSDLQKEMKSKDRVIISVCNKYLKLKRYKRVIQDKFKTLQRNCGEVCENVLKALREHRDVVDSLLDELIKNTSTSPRQEEYIKLVKMNNDLQFENTQLKLYHISNTYLSGDRVSPTLSSRNQLDNYDAPIPLYSKRTCCPRIHYPTDILTASRNSFACFSETHNIRKSISDSDLQGHFYT